MKNPKDPASQKFEIVMENLQRIVQEMENGDLPLDDLISRYEEGMKLVKISSDKLLQAEQKIEVLTKNQNSPATAEKSKPSESSPAATKEDISLF